MKAQRVDSLANLTVEAGGFAPFLSRQRADTLKIGMLTDFYRMLDYDAVALGSKELAYGLNFWKDPTKQGLPVLAANLFSDAKAKKPFFKMKQANRHKDNGQFVIRKDHDTKLGVIGFVSQTAWAANHDSSTQATYKSPWEMGDLVKKVAKKCDHLTVIGEFNLAEADSLAKMMPQINMIVASNIRVDQVSKQGQTVIVSLPPRGNNGNYLEWNLATTDSADYLNKVISLDADAKEDTTVAHMMAVFKERLNGPPPVPANPGTATAQKPVQAPAQKPAQTPAQKPANVMSSPSNSAEVSVPSAAAKPVNPPPPPPPPAPEENDGTRQ